MTRQHRCHRYMTIPDVKSGLAAVVDRATDRVVVGGLPPDEAIELALDWNRHEPPEVSE